MSEQNITLKPGDSARIALPSGIGYVEIRTGGVHGPTGYPAISVGAASDTKNSPAADGRTYEPVYTVRDDTVVLVGYPGPQMMERLIEQSAKVVGMHDDGDHAQCPETCPAKA